MVTEPAAASLLAARRSLAVQAGVGRKLLRGDMGAKSVVDLFG